jgi:hypothetical protein
MATTTPNYGWDVPTSTDYVKDGAVAIETLGDDIDASLFSITGGKGVGLQLLTSTAVSSASSVTVDNVFSANYNNYLISYEGTTSALTNLTFKYRTSGGVDTTDTTYGSISLGVTSANVTVNRTVASSQAFGYFGSGGDVATIVTGIFSRPFLAVPATTFSQITLRHSTVEIEQTNWSSAHNQSTSYAGIKISTGSGTMTGNLRIYGLRNS